MKAVIFEIEPRERASFEALTHRLTVRLAPETLSPANAAQFSDADVISTFIYSELNRDALACLPSLKMIATRSTGYDHIDTQYCSEHGITVCNVPTYGSNTVAEHTFALLLAISHRLREAIERARSGRFSPDGLEGFDLAGRTIGVIGTGNIGRHVIRIALGFNMDVIAFDSNQSPDFASRLGFRYVTKDELLSVADIITLHVPGSPQTDHMLDAKAFAHIKHGAIIINTARGNLIDPRALIYALQSGKIAAAGLDVLPDEPLIREEAELICSIFCKRYDARNLIADHILLNMPNVVVTPHSAFNTREAVQRIVDTTVTNIDAFLEGKARNVVVG